MKKNQTLKSYIGGDINFLTQHGYPLPIKLKNKKEFMNWITNWFQDQPINK